MAGDGLFAPLEALVDPSRGISYGVVQPGHHVDTGVPIVRVTDIRGGKIRQADTLRVSPEIAEKHLRTQLRGGELLLTLVGTVGETAVVSSELRGWNTARAVAVIPVLDDPGSLWVRYALQAGPARAYINSRLNTTVQATLNLGDVCKLPVPMPASGVRRRILGVLGSLDDKIELNRRIGETLETMARALFKSWFVDFDPVRTRADGRAPAGLDATTATLFPSEFNGSLPRGWRLGHLGEFVELQRGTTYKSALKGLPGPVLLGLGSIQRNGGFRDDKLSTYGGESPEKLLVFSGELFVSLKDVTQSADLLGAVARVPRHIANGRLTQDTVKLEFGAHQLIREVVYRTLLTPEYREYCRQHATGTTNLGLSREDFLAYPIVVAPEPVMRAFNEIVQTLTSRAELAVLESRTLASLRDQLLPGLLSGEIDVSRLEQTVEERVS